MLFVIVNDKKKEKKFITSIVDKHWNQCIYKDHLSISIAMDLNLLLDHFSVLLLGNHGNLFLFSIATLEQLLKQENIVLEFWTMRKKKLDQCHQFVLFERSAKQVRSKDVFSSIYRKLGPCLVGSHLIQHLFKFNLLWSDPVVNYTVHFSLEMQLV